MFDNLVLPFSVNDLISSGSGLLGFISSFVLLGLAFVFVPKVIRLIVASFASQGSYYKERGYTTADIYRGMRRK